MGEYFHETVLRDELLEIFAPVAVDWFVDGTVGGGGFSLALLEQQDQARLVGLDVDPAAIAAAGERLAPVRSRATLVRRSYSKVLDVLAQQGLERVDGMVLDLGISSAHLEPERGFSFRLEGPLDMRMDPDNPVTAKAFIDVATEPQLVRVFRNFGEIRGASRLAREVKTAARAGGLQSTQDLVDLVKGAFPNAGSKLLARTFQALRIAVNSELEHLEEFLRDAPGALAVGGRLAVISFQSLEDRMVKHTFRALAKEGGYRVGTRKPIVPTPAEVAHNPRARSAKLRWLERVE